MLSLACRGLVCGAMALLVGCVTFSELPPPQDSRLSSESLAGDAESDTNPLPDAAGLVDVPSDTGEVVAVVGGCPDLFVRSIEVCVDAFAEDDDVDDSAFFLIDQLLACADAEPMAGVWDGHCAWSPDDPVCGRGFEHFVAEVIPDCVERAREGVFAGRCVLPPTWRDFRFSPRLVVLADDDINSATLRPGAGVLEAQLVLAASASAYRVTSAAEALAISDDGLFDSLLLLDIGTNRRLRVLTATFGDSRYGRVFFDETTFVVADIVDGDVYGCAMETRPRGAPCMRALDCDARQSCVGPVVDERTGLTGHGRCLDGADRASDWGAPCASTTDCRGDLGSVCLDTAGGVCAGAWLERRFRIERAELSERVTEVPIVVSGMATVSVSTEVGLVISHPRPADLVVRLLHPGYPDSGSAVLLDADAVGGPEWFRSTRGASLPSDESINGVWLLRIEDTGTPVPGEPGGELVLGELAITSWFD